MLNSEEKATPTLDPNNHAAITIWRIKIVLISTPQLDIRF